MVLPRPLHPRSRFHRREVRLAWSLREALGAKKSPTEPRDGPWTTGDYFQVLQDGLREGWVRTDDLNRGLVQLAREVGGREDDSEAVVPKLLSTSRLSVELALNGAIDTVALEPSPERDVVSVALDGLRLSQLSPLVQLGGSLQAWGAVAQALEIEAPAQLGAAIQSWSKGQEVLGVSQDDLRGYLASFDATMEKARAVLNLGAPSRRPGETLARLMALENKPSLSPGLRAQALRYSALAPNEGRAFLERQRRSVRLILAWLRELEQSQGWEPAKRLLARLEPDAWVEQLSDPFLNGLRTYGPGDAVYWELKEQRGRSAWFASALALAKGDGDSGLLALVLEEAGEVGPELEVMLKAQTQAAWAAAERCQRGTLAQSRALKRGRLELDPQTVEAVERAAALAYPQEMIGVLFFDGTRTLFVEAPNNAGGSARPHASVAPSAYHQLEQLALTLGMRPLAVVHSHPEAAPLFSGDDLQAMRAFVAREPSVRMLICECSAGAPSRLASFQVDEDGELVREDQVVVLRR